MLSEVFESVTTESVTDISQYAWSQVTRIDVEITTFMWVPRTKDTRDTLRSTECLRYKPKNI